VSVLASSSSSSFSSRTRSRSRFHSILHRVRIIFRMSRKCCGSVSGIQDPVHFSTQDPGWVKKSRSRSRSGIRIRDVNFLGKSSGRKPKIFAEFGCSNFLRYGGEYRHRIRVRLYNIWVKTKSNNISDPSEISAKSNKKSLQSSIFKEKIVESETELYRNSRTRNY
jgi:hypothetical protein